MIISSSPVRLMTAFVAVIAALSLSACKDEKKTDTAATETPAATDTASTSEAGQEPSADNPVVAKVDGTNVLRSEVLAFIQTLPPQLQQMPPQNLFPMAVEQVVNAKIVDLKAAKGASSLTSSDEYNKRLEEAKTQILRAVYMEQEIEKNLSDARLQKAYEEFKKQQGNVEEIKARHILVKTEAEAKEVIEKLGKGEDFTALAKARSQDTGNKDSGGDLGYFTKQDMVKEFADAAFTMQKGDTSKEPVKTQFGFHVIQVEDRRMRPVPSFEDVKAGLAVEARREILNELVEGWRKSASVEMFDFNGNPVAKPGEQPAAPAPEAAAPAPGSAPEAAPASPEAAAPAAEATPETAPAQQPAN